MSDKKLWFLWQQISSHRAIIEETVLLYLQVMRTCIKARRSSIVVWPDPTTDCGLAAMERLEKSPYIQWGKWCFHFFSAVFERILFILAGNNGILHKSLDAFEIRPDSTTDHIVSCPWASKDRCYHVFLVAIYLIHFKPLTV